MSDIFILIVVFTFAIFGLTRPAVSFAGYLWVDTVVPQKIVFGFLSGQPLSMMMALVCFASLGLGFNKLKAVSYKTPVFLFILFAIIITASTQQALFPHVADIKWSTVIKTLMMSFFLMFAINTRKQLEMVLLVLLLSLSFFMISAGMKTLLGGGGYGRILIVGGGNSGMAESSTLAAFAVLAIPLILFFKTHNTYLSQLKEKKAIWYSAIIFCLATIIGTTARTGLITIAGYIGFLSLKLKNILRGILLLTVLAFVFVLFAPQSWKDRMNTMTNIENESSAMGRIVVWQWTWDFVKERPLLGGGFESFIANKYALKNYNENFGDKAKAYHSIYFEVLGEHGYLGFLIYCWLIVWTIRKNAAIEKDPSLSDWSRDLGKQMKHMIVIFCIGGAFIGIGYKPILFQLVALTIAHASILDREKDVKQQ